MYHALLVQLLRERHALLHPVIIQNRSWQLIELHRLTSVLLRLCSSLALDPLASNTYGPGSIRVRRSVTHNKQEQCLSHKATKAETPHPTHLRQARARASPRSRPPVRRNVRRELASRYAHHCVRLNWYGCTLCEYGQVTDVQHGCGTREQHIAMCSMLILSRTVSSVHSTVGALVARR